MLEKLPVWLLTSQRPSCIMQEGKVYFSGKQKLYGYKVDVAARQSGIETVFSKHFPGSSLDLGVLMVREALRKARLKNRVNEQAEIYEEILLSDEYPRSWAVFADKGYKSAA